MDQNNLSIKAILMKYRSPFVASLFQKRPSCFPERCLLLDSQHVTAVAIEVFLERCINSFANMNQFIW